MRNYKLTITTMFLLALLSLSTSAVLFREDKAVGINEDGLIFKYNPEDITCSGYYNRTSLNDFRQKCEFILSINGINFLLDSSKDIHKIISNGGLDSFYSNNNIYLEQLKTKEVNDYALKCNYEEELGVTMEYCDYDYNIFGFRKKIGSHLENETSFADIRSLDKITLNGTAILHGFFMVPYNTKDNYNVSTYINNKEYLIPYPTYNTSTQTDFDEGTYYNTTSNASGYVVLANSTSYQIPYYSYGNYTSRIYAGGMSWDNLTFTTPIKYGQQMNMSNSIVLLMHLNNGAGENATFFKDETGKNNGTCSFGYCPTYNISGRFLSAYTFNTSNKTHITVKYNKSLDFNGSFSISAWVKKYDNSTTTYLVRKPAHYWLRITTGNNASFAIINASNVGKVAVSNTSITKDSWAHLVGVFNHTSDELKIYLNGRETGNRSIIGKLANNTQVLLIGYNESIGTDHSLNGTMDEVIIWNRSLSPSEIEKMYVQGAVSLKMQARICEDTCDSEAFIGPDGNADSYFENESQFYILNKSFFSNKTLFQYANYFNTENTDFTPALDEVYLEYVKETLPPNMTLNSPANSSAFNNNFIAFNVTIADNSIIKNVTLFGDFTGVFSENQTNYTEIKKSDFIFYLNLTNAGIYHWAIVSCDIVNNCNTSQTFEFTLDNLPPGISNELYFPQQVTKENMISFTASIDDPSGVDTVFFSENSSGQFKNWTVTDIDYLFSLGIGNYSRGQNVSWRYYANDSLNNLGQGTLHSFYVYNSIPEFETDPLDPSKPAITNPRNSSISDLTPSINWSNAVDSDGDNLTYYGRVNLNTSSGPTVYTFNVVSGVDETKFNISTTLNRTITYYVLLNPSDGIANGTFTQSYFKVNGLPTFNLINITINEDTNLTLNLSGNVSDFNDTDSMLEWTFTLNDTTKFNLTIENGTNIINISTYPNQYGKVELNLTAFDSLKEQNSTTIIVNVAGINDMPLTVLINPLNNSLDSTGNITFIANNSDAEGLNNASLYINISGVWQLNQTIAIDGNYNKSLFEVKNLPTNSYLWNVKTCDTNNLCAFSEINFTIKVELSANETDAEQAIVEGIRNSAINGSQLEYLEQAIYARNQFNSQMLGVFDVVTRLNNQTWAFNYISENETFLNMFNITPVLNVLELSNASTAAIKNRIITFINQTKQ